MISGLAAAQETAVPWLQELLARVPDGTSAVAAVRMPADELGKVVLALLPPAARELADNALERTGKYANSPDLLRQVAAPLLDRVAVVVRQNTRDTEIAVNDPMPLPQLACVFWLRPDAQTATLELLVDTLRAAGWFQTVYHLKVDDKTAITEFCNPKIPGTGELALHIGPQWFLVANSGPLLKGLVSDRGQRGAFLKDVERLSLQDPGPGHGTLLFQAKAVDAILAPWEEPLAAADRACLQQVRSVLQLFPSGVAQLQFSQDSVQLVLARLLGK
jgi:hypothetical protein